MVDAPIKSLSDRERQVLSMAAAGMLDKQIGIELDVSLNTLRTYWSRIRTKLGNHPRAALAVALVASEVRSSDYEEGEHVGHEGWVLDVATNRVIASDGVNDHYGLPRGSAHDLLEYTSLYHPEDAAEVLSRLNAIINGEVDSAHLIFRLVSDSGVEPIHLTLRSDRAPDGSVRRVFAYRARSKDCRPAADSRVRLGSWTRDHPEANWWIDQGFADIMQIDPGDEDLAAAMRKRLHPADWQMVENAVPNAIAAGEEWAQHHARIVLDDGTTFWARAKVHIISQGEGSYRVVGTVAAFR